MTPTTIKVNLAIFKKRGINAMVNIINHYYKYEIKFIKREKYKYHN